MKAPLSLIFILSFTTCWAQQATEVSLYMKSQKEVNTFDKFIQLVQHTETFR